jgi:hypothetical protein
MLDPTKPKTLNHTIYVETDHLEMYFKNVDSLTVFAKERNTAKSINYEKNMQNMQQNAHHLPQIIKGSKNLHSAKNVSVAKYRPPGPNIIIRT